MGDRWISYEVLTEKVISTLIYRTRVKLHSAPFNLSPVYRSMQWLISSVSTLLSYSTSLRFPLAVDYIKLLIFVKPWQILVWYYSSAPLAKKKIHSMSHLKKNNVKIYIHDVLPVWKKNLLDIKQKEPISKSCYWKNQYCSSFSHIKHHKYYLSRKSAIGPLPESRRETSDLKNRNKGVLSTLTCNCVTQPSLASLTGKGFWIAKIKILVKKKYIL